MKRTALVLAFALAWLPGRALAWGERGHHAIARSAALDVLEGVDLSTQSAEGAAAYRSLERLFQEKALQLAHLASIPDTSWRALDPITQALNAPTHYSDADLWTVNFDAIPLDYQEALAKFQGKPDLESGKPISLFDSGTLYWRSQELYGLLCRAFRRLAAAPAGSAEQKAQAREAILYAGILAHFIGDASMPYHNSSDHDGFVSGNGGIHSYFETEALVAETPELETDVFRHMPAAYRLFDADGKFRRGGPQAGVLLARELGRAAFGRILELRKLDEPFLLERSTVTAQGKRVYAKRKSAQEAMTAFRPMIEEQLALSAAALARLWRGAWEEAGKPDLSRASFREYLHEPAFIPPAYDAAAIQRILNTPPKKP